MVVAAFCVSVLASVIAALAAEYARRQAKAARATADIEADRRHYELTPRFSARLEPLHGSGSDYYWLVLTLVSSQSLSEVRVEIPEAPAGVVFTQGQTGVPVSRGRVPARSASSAGPVRHLIPVVWQIEVPASSWPARQLTLSVRAAGANGVWKVGVPIEKFGSPE
jgi:hypothetical protein